MRTIYIRKLRFEEARIKLERELHDAFMDGESYVEILHGIGEGILRRMAIDYVESCGFLKLVETDPMFRSNPGATIVEILAPSKEYINRLKS
ncbi:Smr/MutS family protein [Leptospira sp. 85282-16]|uniref:DNA mismatch repair protein n=1 Tax=Leptospira montravelensis TaxID=2484961 RepID=A0ABY2LV92_9LEPT|nr:MULTISPECIES: Smr/MutS family protein [Leptospira]MCT8332956.1 Smr/MutS family protein [Leptospira sp. 85282-16]TGK84139.1 DNA mismatch repair protein [Leptospira montravelensis]TGL06148.1 DNA mismatch repair protein [Leptospira montravelensis]